jgi:hypothetical protein
MMPAGPAAWNASHRGVPPRLDLRRDVPVMTNADPRLMPRTVFPPSDVLILRAWVDGPAPEGLRVRLIRTHPSGRTLAVSAATVEMTCELVASWLNDLLKRGDPSQPPPDPLPPQNR